jgi:GNAT superfamily N-acetyltransferase
MFASFFDWKHRQSPFGESPAWVAVDGDRVVGFRTYMRWEFLHNGRVRRAVRAVDTATHPDYQGQGIFSKLTRASLDALLEDGVDFVFNTPNDKSRPGYLKMGWREVGRVPVAIRLRAPASAGRVARARVPADKWSASCSAGQPAPEVLSDHTAIEALLASRAHTSGVTTRRTPAFLSWRYGFAPLRYRALRAGDDVADGLVIFRLRRRGPALEAVIADLLVPRSDSRLIAQLVGRVMHETGADYALRAGTPRFTPGFVPLPGQGPILTWRDVCAPHQPPLHEWHLSMGDVELF